MIVNAVNNDIKSENYDLFEAINLLNNNHEKELIEIIHNYAINETKNK